MCSALLNIYIYIYIYVYETQHNRKSVALKLQGVASKTVLKNQMSFFQKDFQAF